MSLKCHEYYDNPSPNPLVIKSEKVHHQYFHDTSEIKIRRLRIDIINLKKFKLLSTALNITSIVANHLPPPPRTISEKLHHQYFHNIPETKIRRPRMNTNISQNPSKHYQVLVPGLHRKRIKFFRSDSSIFFFFNSLNIKRNENILMYFFFEGGVVKINL